MRGFENNNLTEDEQFEAMGWYGKKEEAPKPPQVEVSKSARPAVVEKAPVSREERGKSTETPAYVQEALDREVEAKAQRIFGPKSKRDRGEGWQTREIADLEAYNALLDRRDQEAAQAEIEEARRLFIMDRDAIRAEREQQTQKKKTG